MTRINMNQNKISVVDLGTMSQVAGLCSDFYVALTIFHPYRDLEAGDAKSLTKTWF